MSRQFNVRTSWGRTRLVEVPAPQCESTGFELTEWIFHFGQNDFQARPQPSVSVGDIMEVDNKLFLVEPIGCREITKEEADTIERSPAPQRILGAYGVKL